MTALHRFLSWLRKPTASKQLVPQMEGLRFVALLSVFMLHFEQVVQYRLASGEAGGAARFASAFCGVGDFGVQLFFAVSGFVLALPFARWRLLGGRPVGLGHYMVRRLWRLEPPLLINLLIMLVVTVWVLKKLSLMEGLWRFGMTMSYLHYVTLGEMSPLNRVTWSLETEAQFYLAMPVLALVFKIGKPVWRRLLMVSLAALCMAFKAQFNKAMLPAQFEYFAAGIVLADFYLTDWSGRLGKSSRWDVAGAVAWMAVLVTLMSFAVVENVVRSWLLVILVFVAFGAALMGRVSYRLWAGRAVTLIGGMCYSFYLYHDPVLKLAGGRLFASVPDLGYWARFGLGLLVLVPLVMAVTVVMYALCERPFMGRKPARAAQTS